jgi:hypothetical protein
MSDTIKDTDQNTDDSAQTNDLNSAEDTTNTDMKVDTEDKVQEKNNTEKKSVTPKTTHHDDNTHSELFVLKVISGVLGAIIIVGLVLVLKYGNFGGIDQRTLKAQYIKKSDIKFYDLPIKEQKRYRLKTDSTTKIQAASQSQAKTSAAQVDPAMLNEYKNRVKTLEIELYNYKQASLDMKEKVDLLKIKDEEIKILKDRLLAYKEKEKPNMAKKAAPSSISNYLNQKTTTKESSVDADSVSIKSYLSKKVKPEHSASKRYKSQTKISSKKTPRPDKTLEKEYYNIHYYKSTKHTQKLHAKYADFAKDLVLVKRIYCKEYEAGSYEMPKECQAVFEKFIKSSTKKAVFEIIPVIDDKDFAYIQNTTPSKEFERFSEMGLGKLRSNEVGWKIKKTLGKDVNLKYVPYNAYTDKDRRGVIVKVYK